VGLAPRHAPLRRLIAASIVLVVSGCTRAATVAPESHLIERIGLAMGSEVKLTAWTPDAPAAAAAFDEVFREFERLEALMSIWHEGSDIQRLNAAAGRNASKFKVQSSKFKTISSQFSVLSSSFGSSFFVLRSSFASEYYGECEILSK
jgi:thiamine biosynthesis lipoprotein ApbE